MFTQKPANRLNKSFANRSGAGGVKMNAVEIACAGHGRCVKEAAGVGFCNPLVSGRKRIRLLNNPAGCRPFSGRTHTEMRGRNDEDARRRHTPGIWEATHNLYQPRHPSECAMHSRADLRLEIICAKHDNDEVKRRMSGKQHRQCFGSITLKGDSMVVVGGCAATQAFSMHSKTVTSPASRILGQRSSKRCRPPSATFAPQVRLSPKAIMVRM